MHSQDVIELRERKWMARNKVAAPTTIAQVHEAVSNLYLIFYVPLFIIHLYHPGCKGKGTAR